MRVKAIIVVGAGLGYILGTRTGRQQFDKFTGWTQDLWADPRVQAQVNGFEAKVTEFARTEGPALKDKVTEFARTEGPALKDKVTEFARTEGPALKETVTGTVQHVVASFTSAANGSAEI